MTLFLIVLLVFLALVVWMLFLLVIRRSSSERGNTFGDYTLLEIIGRGGMATIYRAKNRILKRIVAVKVLDQSLINDADLVYKFLKEGENLARINTRCPDSPVVKALEYGYHSAISSYFISMQYLQGINLLDMIKAQQPIDLKTKLYIIKEVARAMHSSHTLKIFHRDISPDNIFVNGNKVTLIDFGIAKQEFSKYRTMHRAILGKPYYMSPEQSLGERITGKSDVYSLGAVLFYLLEGKPLYESKNPIEIMKMHEKEPVPAINAPIPGELKNFIYNMLAKEPGTRPNAKEVADTMKLFINRGV